VAIGDGAHQWLVEAAAGGAQRIRSKMVRATELASLVGSDVVDRALGLAATAARFDFADLESIVDHLAQEPGNAGQQLLPGTSANLNRGTLSWDEFGR
jgi:hypothetical protein